MELDMTTVGNRIKKRRKALHLTQMEIKEKTGAVCLVADARGGKDLYEEKWGKGQTLWVFGSEGLGVSEKALELSDLTLLIPLESRVESLNVATAASVCLFEQRRRRLSGIVHK